MSSDIRVAQIPADVAMETALLSDAVAAIVRRPVKSLTSSEAGADAPAALCRFSLFMRDKQHLFSCLWVFVYPV